MTALVAPQEKRVGEREEQGGREVLVQGEEAHGGVYYTAIGVTIEAAGPADDAALLDFMKTTTLPGEITLAMQREPSLFAARPVLGHCHQVLVSREGARVVGMAERAERRLFVNGAATTVGYRRGSASAPSSAAAPRWSGD